MWPNQKGKNSEENSSKVKGRQSGSGGKAKQTRTKMKAVQPPLPEQPHVSDERTELEDQVSGVWKNRIMQPQKTGPQQQDDPLLQKIQSKTTNEITERQKMANLQEAMIRMVDRMFDSFQNSAYEFNMRTGGSDLELNWVRPSIMRESSNAWHQKAAHIEVFTGRMSTRYWTLVIRGTFDGVLAYIIPADKLISFGLNPSEFKPYFDIKPACEGFDIIWKIDDKIVSQDLFPSIYRSLMDALIAFAQDEGSICEQFDLAEIGISSHTEKPKSKEEEEYARRYQAALQKAEDRAFLFSDNPEPAAVPDANASNGGWQEAGTVASPTASEGGGDDGWLPIAPVGGNQAEWKNMGNATRTRMESQQQQSNDSQSSGQYAQMRIEPFQSLAERAEKETGQTGQYHTGQFASMQTGQFQQPNTQQPNDSQQTGQYPAPSQQSGQYAQQPQPGQSLQSGQHAQQSGQHVQQSGQYQQQPSQQSGQYQQQPSQQSGQYQQQSPQQTGQYAQQPPQSQQSGQYAQQPQQSQQSGTYAATSMQSGQYASQQSGTYASPSLEPLKPPADSQQSGSYPAPQVQPPAQQPAGYPPSNAPSGYPQQSIRQSGQFSTRQGFPYGSAPSGQRPPSISENRLQSQQAPQSPTPYQQIAPRTSNSRLQAQQQQRAGNSNSRLPSQGLAGRGIYQPAGYQHPSMSKADQLELLSPAAESPNAVPDDQNNNSLDSGTQKPPMGLYDRLADSIGAKSSESWPAPPPPSLRSSMSKMQPAAGSQQQPGQLPTQSNQASPHVAQFLSLTEALKVLLPGLDAELESLARQGGEAFSKRDFKLADDILKWSGRLSQFREEAADLLHELSPEE